MRQRLAAYFTDVEGQWDKLAGFCARNPVVSLDAAGRLQIAPGAVFVFGGDTVDRGPAGRRILRALVEVKRRQPEQVVLLAGNRDLNKLRLPWALSGAPPARTPEAVREGPKGGLLRWILGNTMNAPKAFEHRAAELGGADDDAVVQSYLEDVAEGGAMREYLLLARLAHREGTTLFVHGAVTAENLGVVPLALRTDDVDEWLANLNAFLAGQVRAFVDEDGRIQPGEPAWAEVIRYQSPLRGTRLNQASVVYGKLTDDDGNPRLPQRVVTERLARAGISRLIVGHTPSGDCPAVLRDEGFELVLADNSYGRLEVGSQVLLDEGWLRVVGATVLDGGERAEVGFSLARHDSSSPVGRSVGATRELVKARLARGDLLLFKSLPGYQRVQRVLRAEELATLALGPPPRLDEPGGA